MIQSVNQNILLPCSFNPGTIFQVPKNIQNYPGSDFSLYLQVLNPMCPNLQNILLQCAGQESKLLTPINWCQESPPHTHRMLGIEWLYYLHIPSDLPPRVLSPYTEWVCSWHYIYTTNIIASSHIGSFPSSAKCSKLYRDHCASLVRALCRADRFTNIGHPGHSTALGAQHYALCTCSMYYVLYTYRALWLSQCIPCTVLHSVCYAL